MRSCFCASNCMIGNGWKSLKFAELAVLVRVLGFIWCKVLEGGVYFYTEAG